MEIPVKAYGSLFTTTGVGLFLESEKIGNNHPAQNAVG
jgi:hypothetical protein